MYEVQLLMDQKRTNAPSEMVGLSAFWPRTVSIAQAFCRRPIRSGIMHVAITFKGCLPFGRADRPMDEGESFMNCFLDLI